MSYLPLNPEICGFIVFSMVEFRILSEISIKTIILSCISEEIASKLIKVQIIIEFVEFTRACKTQNLIS